ncbi:MULTISPECIES: ABC transporter permease [unclassified Nocardioides]|uniref:ABC transporter permease n=1 Tax=unclassified Nocardioides TaxID=2615069 RepID=UPI0006F61C20|nr:MULTISPECIES: ABC transporter permease [unclassified Nocardioides]KRA39174.1 ABC transporter permease [Nocardioides sp. Root614]KRA93133.1 ABC transporter permease [Nocardioides sp. Root682]
MTTLALTARDSVTMLRRNLKHMVRYPSLTIMLIAQPVLFLLLFVYVFGGTMGAGLPGGGGRDDYLAYVAPAILLVTVCSVALSIAIYAAKDATEGIIDRFRTMPIAKSSVLTGLVLAALVQTALALTVVLVIAVALGWRPDAGPVGWLGAIGVLALLAIALTWLCVALGLAADSVETASNSPMFLVLLPFISSAFVPTDSMSTGLAWVAENQPFTPIIDTLRACFEGRAPGADLAWAIGWCVLITVLSFAWACRLFARAQAR